MKKGITIAGTIAVDTNKYIEVFPQEGTLVKILDQTQTFGGCVSNTAINLSLIEPGQNIHVSGNVGDDVGGEKAIEFYKKYDLNVDQVKRIKGYQTVAVDSYINIKNKKRTFFADMRVSATYGMEKITSRTSHFHIGYLLLLPYLDEVLEDGSTRMAHLLKELQDAGIKTSIDLVTDEGDLYEKIVVPALPYVNYLIVNEIEASRIAGIKLYEDNLQNIEKLKEICAILKQKGVNDLVVIHAPEFGICYDGKDFIIVPSLDLPKEFIKSSVGAGDGFCAGTLYGILNDYTPEEMLRLASCVAAGVLNSDTSQSEIKSLKEFKALEERFGRKKL